MLDSQPDAPADALIRGAGLRVTATRVAVLEALRDRPHATADDVFARVSGTLAGTSKQSVYNALGDFADAVSRAASNRPGTPARSSCASATTTTTWCARAAAASTTWTASSARLRVCTCRRGAVSSSKPPR